MLKKYLFALLILFVPVGGYAFALHNWYVRGLAGCNYTSGTEFGYAVGGSVGYKFLKTFRLEGEITYRNNEIDKIRFDDGLEVPFEGHLSSLNCLANVLFTPSIKFLFIPYFGVGAGWGQAKQKGEISTQAIHFALEKTHKSQARYQVILGLNLLQFYNIECDIEYHYLASFNIDGSDHTLALAGAWTF